MLGGKHDGGLQLPSQLLPFLIGMFSFLRIVYQLLREFFTKKEGDLEAFHNKRTKTATRSRGMSLLSRRARSSLGPSFQAYKGLDWCCCPGQTAITLWPGL